jgi:hypothetical protein
VQATGDETLTVTLTMSDGKPNTTTIKFLDDNRLTATGSVPGMGDQQMTLVRATPAP